MLNVHKKIRNMSQQRKSHLTALLGVGIVVNDAVDQRIIHYDTAKQYGSRQLKDKDKIGELEWCSFPWYDGLNKEFVCVGQLVNEQVLIQLNPYNNDII